MIKNKNRNNQYEYSCYYCKRKIKNKHARGIRFNVSIMNDKYIDAPIEKPEDQEVWHIKCQRLFEDKEVKNE